jgi:hypothetical protein
VLSHQFIHFKRVDGVNFKNHTKFIIVNDIFPIFKIGHYHKNTKKTQRCQHDMYSVICEMCLPFFPVNVVHLVHAFK